MTLSRLVWIVLGFLALAGLSAVVARFFLAPAPLVPTTQETPRSAAIPPASLRYAPTPLGAPVSTFGRPMVTGVHLADLDRDGLLDVLYCEGQLNSVRWLRQAPRGTFTETILAADIPGPARVSTADVDANGQLDVLVASMGQITPNNDRIGAVIVLENIDNRRFERRVLLERTARVTDVQAANLRGHADGRLDLVVGQFGYAQGQVRWMENLGDWQFRSHVVNSLSGCVHTPVADFDGDGRLDFAALISQEWEEVHLFRNRVDGTMRDEIIWGSTNEDFGSSGLTTADLNGDGRPDLICTNGDGFDYAGHGTRPWHGVQWLENLGEGRFAYHRIGALPGAYAPCAADLNGDGALDLVTVSGFADWSDPESVSLMGWINDGQQNFAPVVLAHRPGQLVAADVGDLDGNGVPVIVTGGFHAYPPFENMSSVTLWRRQ